jgi:hypothetical protein
VRYYGLINEEEFFKIVKVVCDSLGYGANDNADELLTETAKAETRLGLMKDKTILNVGVGLMQFDKIGFEDTKQRSMKYKDKILDKLKVDISKVELNHLAYNPFLSILFARLKYKLIPEEIPTTLEGRAKYWKRYYNTNAGAGTILHYLKNVDNC